MCGFVGFTGRDEALLRKAAAQLVHRGPDGEGYFQDAHLSLGHRRLAILDLTDSGAQPMQNPSGSLQLVYNGEIYNYLELREELQKKGYDFRSRTDTEVLLYAYQEWGEEMLPRLNGMFAFAIYDLSRKKIFLARDHFGIKPLYYTSHGSKFVFASEIKPILLFSEIRPKENPAVLYDYLFFNCYDHTEETFFQGVRTLPPGHCAAWDLESQTLSVKQWYDVLTAESKIPARSEEQTTEEFRELFFDSLRLRMRTDVEIGSCLSGGLDSSSILCSLKKISPEMNGHFKVFSAIMRAPGLNEAPYVDEVVQKTGVQPHTCEPSALGIFTHIQKLIEDQEEPFGGASIFAQWEVMRLANQMKIKVLLDGQGGDELLAGYPFFAGYYFLELLRKGNWLRLLGEAAAYGNSGQGATREGFLSSFFFLLPGPAKPFFWKQQYPNILNPAFEKAYQSKSQIPYLLYAPHDLNRALRLRLRYSLPQLLREEDRNSMAFSIEARLPFLDPRLVERVLSLPPRYKIRGGRTKYLLRESMKEILPEKIQQRTTKLGFTTPLDDWLRAEVFRNFVESIFWSKNWRSGDYVDQKGIQALFLRHRNRQVRGGQALWKALNLELWMRRFL